MSQEREEGHKRKQEEHFFVVEQIMDNGNILLRDWNKNEIKDKSVPPQQLTKIYLDDMKMEDLEMDFKKCRCEEECEDESKAQQTHTQNIKSMNNPISTLTASLNRMASEDKKIESLTTTPTVGQNKMGSEEKKVEPPTTTPIQSENESFSPTLSMTTTPILRHHATHKSRWSRNVHDNKYNFNPDSITIPNVNGTLTFMYKDDKLLDLTPIKAGSSTSSRDYVDISDDEPTFMDEEVIVHKNTW